MDPRDAFARARDIPRARRRAGWESGRTPVQRQVIFSRLKAIVGDAPDATGESILNRWLAVLLAAAAACAYAGDGGSPQAGAVCSEAWYRSIEERFPTGDGRGHGPDLGSEEWKGVVEFRLGIRGKPHVPSRASPEWCRYIDQLVRARPISLTRDERSAATKPAQGPAYPCNRARGGSIEAREKNGS